VRALVDSYYYIAQNTPNGTLICEKKSLGPDVYCGSDAKAMLYPAGGSSWPVPLVGWTGALATASFMLTVMTLSVAIESWQLLLSPYGSSLKEAISNVMELGVALLPYLDSDGF
jgi:hypothetical protein